MKIDDKSHNYRPDIDGLRTVAVVSVVFYHAFSNFITGGFVGVDVFFVISGYLITGILIKELENDTFSIIRFYERRIKRLFPALLTVFVVTFLFGWYVLIENEFIQFNKHILSGIGFVSNLVLWSEAGYFDTSALSKPFLHLWSLGVEEQFYIFVPFLLYFIWKAKINLTYTLLLLIILSLSFNIYNLSYDSTSAFYNPIGRSWELFTGSLLAILSHQGYFNRNSSQFTSIIGLLLILFSVFFYHKHISFPGLMAIPPVLGACLIIAARPTDYINRFILSNRLMVWIGLISYPLYLWHWPILTFQFIIEGGRPSFVSRLSVVILSFILAALTFILIEKPLRKLKMKAVIIPSLLMSLIGIISFLSYLSLLKPRLSLPDAQKIFIARSDFTYPVTGMKPYGDIKDIFFALPTNKKETTVFIGDSTLQHYIPRIKMLTDKNPNYYNSVIFATRGGCVPVIGLEFYPNEKYGDCRGSVKKSFEIAKQPEVTKVVISAGWIGNFIDMSIERILYLESDKIILSSQLIVDHALKQLGNSIAELSKTKKVYLMTASPLHDAYDPMSMIEGSRLKAVRVKASPQPAIQSEFYDKYKTLHEKLLKLAKDNGAILIDPIPAFCQNGLCPVVNENGEPYFKDNLHMRPFTVIEKAGYLDVTIEP